MHSSQTSLPYDIQFGRLTPMPNCSVAAGMSLIRRFNAAFQRRHRHPSSRSDGVNIAVGFNQWLAFRELIPSLPISFHGSHIFLAAIAAADCSRGFQPGFNPR